MKKEERDRLLKKLKNSSQGMALNEVIEDLIEELKETALNAKDMHEVKGSKFAIKKLESLRRRINIEEDTNSTHNYE